jgi:hypothetical protein
MHCRICHNETLLDDVALRHDKDRCICLRCFGRHTGTTLQTSPALRLAVSDVLLQSRWIAVAVEPDVLGRTQPTGGSIIFSVDDQVRAPRAAWLAKVVNRLLPWRATKRG